MRVEADLGVGDGIDQRANDLPTTASERGMTAKRGSTNLEREAEEAGHADHDGLAHAFIVVRREDLRRMAIRE